MVKTYHTIDFAEWAEHIALYHPTHGSHYINLPNGRILMAAHFATEWAEEAFHLRTKTKLSLPHPVFSGNEKIARHHVEELHHLFDGGRDEAGQATVRHIVQKASALHPLMRLSVY